MSQLREAGESRRGTAERPATVPSGEDASAAAAARTDRGRGALIVAALTAVIAVPILIAVVAVRTPRWYPLVDLAQIEMRVRDVGTRHPPLVGLGGRIFGLDTQGAHPGPISFYILAPVYRLLGSSAWALQVSAATLNLAVLAATVWAGHRRWGLRGALLVAAGLALVMRMYGTTVLVYPWNPYMPVLFWMLFLVCVWGVLCDDLPLLPVAVLAGCVCAQTHIPYAGLVGGLGLLAIGSLALAYRRARGDAATRRRLVRWTAGSMILGLVLWVPVFVDQLRGDPGNLGVIVDSFRDPVEDAVGLATAWRLLTRHLDVVQLLQGDRHVPASPWPGVALLVGWAVAAAGAVRLRDRTLLRLHVVVAAALLLGLVTISRILGVTWFYLTLWAYGTAVLAIVAVVATVATAVAARRQAGPSGSAPRAARTDRAALAALGLAVVVPTVLLAWHAPDTEDTDAVASEQLGRIMPAVVDAIDDGTVPGGHDGTFLITWVDPVNLGGQGLGLMLELERQGFDARSLDVTALSVRDHRVTTRTEADAEIHLAAGPGAIDGARAHVGARELAYYDPRTGAQIARYERNRTVVIDGLTAAGLDDLVPEVDNNLFRLTADARLPEDLQRPLYIMGSTPQPVAVYTWDPTP